MSNYKVFVLDKDSEPLMPTTRFSKVHRMLKEGKAKVVTSKPFTIQLCYEPETHIVLKVAVNRKKACSVDQLTGKETKQASDSLEDWFNKMVGKVGKEEAMRLRSSLVVKKSTRVKNNMGRHLPGAIFSYNNTNYALRANHGDYVNAVGSDKEFPRKDVVFAAESSGLVYL